jgi:hypothetical protein
MSNGYLQVVGSSVIHIEHPVGEAWCTKVLRLSDPERRITVDRENVNRVPLPENGDKICQNCHRARRDTGLTAAPGGWEARAADKENRYLHRALNRGKRRF